MKLIFNSINELDRIMNNRLYINNFWISPSKIRKEVRKQKHEDKVPHNNIDKQLELQFKAYDSFGKLQVQESGDPWQYLAIITNFLINIIWKL